MTTTRNRYAKWLVMAALLVVAVAAPRMSQAAYDGNCVVNDVSWGATPGTSTVGTLFVNCSSGTSYWAFVNTTGCTGVSVDSAKLMETIALSAYLSGRVAAITYNMGNSSTINGCLTTQREIVGFELH
jgi:hypothetical protein